MRISFVSQPRDFIVASGVQWGSVAIVTWELARQLAARGHEVIIYAPLSGGQPREERSTEGILIRRMTHAHRRVHRAVDLGTAMLRMHPPYFSRRAYFREYVLEVANWLRRDPPDVVHVQVASQFIPLLRRAVPSSALVLHAHDETLTRVGRAMMEPRLAAVDAVVTCSDYVTQRWRARFPAHAQRISTAGNGADLQRFHPHGESNAPAESRPREILYVGRVSPEKGVHILASAFDRLARSMPDVRLTIVGPAGLLPFSCIALLRHDVHVASLAQFYGHGLIDRLRKQVLQARHGYVDEVLARLSAQTRTRVEITGAVDQDDLPDIYRRASVLVAPSMLHEPFGLPLAEALASGLPIIASRAGGMASVVDEGVTGLLVERGDAVALASSLRRLLMDATGLLEMRKAARAAAEARFGWEHAANNLEAVYLRALPRARGLHGSAGNPHHPGATHSQLAER